MSSSIANKRASVPSLVAPSSTLGPSAAVVVLALLAALPLWASWDCVSQQAAGPSPACPSPAEGLPPDAASAEAAVSSTDATAPSPPVRWYTAYDALLDADPICNIPRVEASTLSRDAFASTYLDQRPVILRHAINNSRFTQLVQKQPLLDLYGDTLITLSSANRNSYAKREVPLRTYVEEFIHVPQRLNATGADSWYHFGDNKHSEWAAVFDQYTRPSQYTFGPYSSLSFGIGSSGSGVPFHTHGPVFAEVFHGRKRWWLQAPTGPEPRFDGDQSSVWWLQHVLPTYSREERGRLHECVCDVGDLLYIPGLWHHATLNMGQTVFMSIFV